MLFQRENNKIEWVLAFLGNPGREYEKTRHNMGFQTAALLEKQQNVSLLRLKFHALTAVTDLGGARVLCMKPQTFMNLSGEAVGEAARFYRLPPERVLVIYDDVSLPVGKIRVRPGGSAGGHNGIKNIIAHLGTDQFPRVKIGVGAPPHPEYDMIDWVVGVPPASEQKQLEEAQRRALSAAECLIKDGITAAMNRYN